MATLVETGVEVIVEIRRSGETQSLSIIGHSFDADGKTVRIGQRQDVTSALTPEQIAAALLIIDAAEAYYKSEWGIA